MPLQFDPLVVRNRRRLCPKTRSGPAPFSALTIAVDGGCTLNPGRMDQVLVIGSAPPAYRKITSRRPGTNHLAAWRAVLGALQKAADLGEDDVELVCDAGALPPRHAMGRSACRTGPLQGCVLAYERILRRFQTVTWTLVDPAANAAGLHVDGLRRRHRIVRRASARATGGSSAKASPSTRAPRRGSANAAATGTGAKSVAAPATITSRPGPMPSAGSP